MNRSMAIAVVVSLGIWQQTAAAQRPNAQPYFASGAPAPTVSPYLNLGVNENGLSNYPSLVRPLLNDREARARQAAAFEKTRLQAHMPIDGRAAGAAVGRDTNERSQSRRFMYYSHYFGGER